MAFIEKILLLILVFANAMILHSQVDIPHHEFRLDSLEKELATHRKQDEGKLTLLNHLVSAYANVDLEKGLVTGTRAIELAQKLNNSLLLAQSFHNKGFILALKGQYDQAEDLYENALALNKALNNKFGVAQNTLQLGDLAKRKGDNKKALILCEESLKLFEEINSEEGIAKALYYVGSFYYSDPAKAMDIFQRAFNLNEKLGNKYGLAASHSGIGTVHFRLSDFPKALASYQKALDLNGQTGNKRVAAANLLNIGLVHQSISDYRKSLDFYQQALVLFEDVGDQNNIGAALGSLGTSYSNLSDYPKALEYYQKALAISEKSGNQKNIAQNLTRIGNIYGRLSDELKALEYLQKSLSIYELLGDPNEIAGCYNNIGRAYSNMDDNTKALEYYHKALTINEQTGNKNYLAINLLNIGAIYEAELDYSKALDFAQRALIIHEQTGNKSGVAASLGNIGNVYREAPAPVLQSHGINPANRYTMALKYLNQSLQIAREIGAIDLEEETLGNISRTYELQGDFANAFSYYKKYIMLGDSIQGRDVQDEITRKELQFEFQANEAELRFQQQLTDAQLQKQQLINSQQKRIYLLAVVAFLAILGVMISRLWYARRKQELLIKQREIEHREAKRLLELDKLKTNLYTTITHEFRTPLTLILGPVQKMLSKKENTSDDNTITNLSLIERNGKRLLSLVNQILDLQKIEAKQLAPQYEQGDIMTFLHYLVDSFQSLAERKNISLGFQSEPGSFLMDYDDDKLQKICTNLLSNAVKFTPDGGSIRVTAEAKGKWLEIAVSDTGIGIPEENMDKIFNLFYQVEHTSTRRQDGTGIGLTLVKELVELTGGSIRVVSEKEKGSIFKINLPIKNEALFSKNNSSHLLNELNHVPASDSLLASESLEENGSSSPLILVIEDNKDVARYLGSCLEGLYRVEFAVDGKNGIDLAIALVPDIVISDVMMPEADGFEVCRFLKEDPRTSHIPVILLTALSDVKDRLEGLRRGADAYLTKPFHEEELLLTVDKLLQLRKILRERYTDLKVLSGTDDLIIDSLDKVDTSPNFDLLIEDAFISKAIEIINRHLEDNEFTVEDLNREMGMSNTQLFRKLKALTNLSANQLIRHVRLARAKELLRHSNMTIAEIAYQTGFSDPSYFTRIFSREVGMTPTVFINPVTLKG